MNNKTIYLHRNATTHKVFYVGIGNSNRPYSKCRSNEWKEVVARDGYTIEIIEENLSQDEAEEREIDLIGLIGRKDLGLGELVNQTNGGRGTRGFVSTKEHKEAISKANSGENNGMYGVRITGKDHHQYGVEHTKERRIKAMLTRRRKRITDKNYFKLVEDIQNKINKTLKITRAELMAKYDVRLEFLNTHIKKVRNNNIIKTN